VSGDGASCVVDNVKSAVQQVFSPTSEFPPLGGGTEIVRLFANNTMPTEIIDLHVAECECEYPFLWVRLLRRYRSENFPQPSVAPAMCGVQVVEVEIGIARCAALRDPGSCDWTDLEEEFEISMDDSWRIERALCLSVGLLKRSGCSDMVAMDAVVPHGPEGGVFGWVGTLYVNLSS
jgi:hypothetical protein